MLERLGEYVDVDIDAVKRYFPKAGHSHLQTWSGRKGILIRFGSLRSLEESYQFCIENTVPLKITFCMQRAPKKSRWSTWSTTPW